MARNPTNPAGDTPVAPHSDQTNPHAAGAAGGGLGLVAPTPATFGGDPGIDGRIGGTQPLATIPNPQTDVVRSAVRTNAEKDAAVPTPKKYRIGGGGGYFNDGHQGRQFLRPGKIVDARQYDLVKLKASGIRLEEVTDDDNGEFYVVPPTADTPPQAF